MADTVTMSLKSYNELKEMNAQLLQENVALDKALKEAQESDGLKVIVRDVNHYIKPDFALVCKEVRVETDTNVVGFDDVRKEVEDYYKTSIKDLKQELKDAHDKIDKEVELRLSKSEEIIRLKNRNLWQRILNK